MQKLSNSTKELPPFIGDFNGMYSFIKNIGTLFLPVFSLPDAPPEQSDYSEIVDWMNSISENLDHINSNTEDLINSGNLTESQLNDLMSIQQEQLDLLNNINEEVNRIDAMLSYYLPLLLEGIENIQKQNQIIINKLNEALLTLESLERKIDIIDTNLKLSMSISQVSESLEKVKSICSSFYSIANILKNSNVNDTTKRGIYLKSFNMFCNNIALGGANDLIMYLDTIHSIVMGNGIDKKSLFESYIAYGANFNASSSVHPVSFMCFIAN